MKNKTRLLTALAGFALAMVNLAAAKPLLYSQTAPVTVPCTPMFTWLSSGPFLGTKTISFEALAPGQVIRMRTAGVISTGSGPQTVMPLFYSGIYTTSFLSSMPFEIPGGLDNALCSIDVTIVVQPWALTNGMTWQSWYRGTVDCTLTINGVQYVARKSNPTLPQVWLLGPGDIPIEWKWYWISQDPVNTLTAFTLVTEWLR